MHLSEYSMYSQLRSTLAVDRVMKSVLSITKDLVIRQVTLRNPAEAKSLDELVRVVSIIQLWFIWHSRVASSSKQSDKEDPVADSQNLVRTSMQDCTVDEADKVWKQWGTGRKVWRSSLGHTRT